MKHFFYLILFLICLNIGIEQLTNLKISGAEILFIRAIFNLLVAFGIAYFTKKNIIPKKVKLQLGTFLCIGLGLLLNFSAFQFISASSVSTLQRLDIPLLCLFAMFRFKFSIQQFLLCILVFTVVGCLIFINQTTKENPIGYLLILSSVVVLSINTILQKKIAISENLPTIMVIVSLSSVFWGGIRCLQTNSTFENIHLSSLIAIFGLAIINVFIFYIVNDLYKKYHPEFVRYPYLLSAFGTMIVEMLINQKLLNKYLIIGNIIILILLTILVYLRQDKNEKLTE